MPYLLSELADALQLELIGDPNISIERVAGLEQAGAHDISFYTGARHKPALMASRAAAVILSAGDSALFRGNKLISDNPYASYARIAQKLYPRQRRAAGIHETAFIDATARIDPSASIAQNVVVEAGAELQPDCQIGAGSYLGKGVTIGRNTIVFPNVTVHEGTRIGSDCLIHSGAVLGADGFGHARDKDGWIFIPQLGNVQLGDNVSIGANTTIDRGTIGDTVIGSGVKLDNLIHIAHNVQVGDHTAMAAGCGIAGSTRIGMRCTFAGQVGVADNLEICDDAHFTGRTVVLKNITRPGVYSSGILVEETTKWRRNALRFNQLDSIYKQIRDVLKRADD
jgi:UDP-3-O-[3-hydroxymyristoyl] glucosamine N-acyltransferase